MDYIGDYNFSSDNERYEHFLHMINISCRIINVHLFVFGPERIEIPQIVAMTFLIFGIVGNVITVATIFAKARMRTPTFTMLACLAVEDLTGLIVFYVFYWTG